MKNAQDYLKLVYEGTAETQLTVESDWEQGCAALDEMGSYRMHSFLAMDFGQGRAVFGGLVAGMMMAAMRREVPLELVLLSMSCTFAGSVLSNKPFTIETQILRQGKNALTIEAYVRQIDSRGNNAPVLMFASFGSLRASEVQMSAEPPPTMKSIKDAYALPFFPNVFPLFMKHVSMNWALGGLSFFGQGSREMGGWWRWKDIFAQELDPVLAEAHQIALADTWPPAVLPFVKKPVPASSMTWTMNFIHPMPVFQNDWQCYRAIVDHSKKGYAQTRSHIWTRQGQLIATSTQLVAIFDTQL